MKQYTCTIFLQITTLPSPFWQPIWASEAGFWRLTAPKLRLHNTWLTLSQIKHSKAVQRCMNSAFYHWVLQDTYYQLKHSNYASLASWWRISTINSNYLIKVNPFSHSLTKKVITTSHPKICIALNATSASTLLICCCQGRLYSSRILSKYHKIISETRTLLASTARRYNTEH